MKKYKNKTLKSDVRITSIFRSFLAVIFVLLLVSGCSESPFSPPVETNPSGGQITFGLVEVTISGIGTDKMTATAESAVKNTAADLTRPDGSDGSDGSIQLKPVSNGSFTYGVRGAGTFGPMQTYPLSTGSLGSVRGSVALGDMNGDGSLDIVVPNSGSNDVSVLLNVKAVEI